MPRVLPSSREARNQVLETTTNWKAMRSPSLEEAAKQQLHVNKEIITDESGVVTGHGIKVIRTARFFGRRSSFARLELDNMMTPSVKHHAHVASLTVKFKFQIEIIQIWGSVISTIQFPSLSPPPSKKKKQTC